MIEITTYDKKYRDDVINLIEEILKNEYHRNIDTTDLYNIEEEYFKHKGIFWIALDENKNLVGTIGLKDYNNNVAYLKRLYVKKEFRKQGIGGKLIDVFLEYAKENNFKEIYLATVSNRLNVMKFYEENVFERIEAMPEYIPVLSGQDAFFRHEL